MIFCFHKWAALPRWAGSYCKRCGSIKTEVSDSEEMMVPAWTLFFIAFLAVLCGIAGFYKGAASATRECAAEITRMVR